VERGPGLESDADEHGGRRGRPRPCGVRRDRQACPRSLL